MRKITVKTKADLTIPNEITDELIKNNDRYKLCDNIYKKCGDENCDNCLLADNHEVFFNQYKNDL